MKNIGLNKKLEFFFYITFFLVKKVFKKTSQKYAQRSSRNSTIFTFRYRYTKILNSRFTTTLLAFLAVQRTPMHLYKSKKITYFLFILFNTFFSFAQENLKKDSKLNSKSKSIERGYERNEREIDIAVKYEELAKELSSQKDYVKAEEYQEKSIEIYTKLKAKNELAEALRKLGKIQESMSNKLNTTGVKHDADR